MYANPSSNIILPTVRENMKYREPPAAVTTTAVPFVPNVSSPLKTVLTDVPDTTPVTVVSPAKPIPTVTFPTSLVVRWDVPLITPAINVHLATPTLVPVFPAALTLTAPVVLVTATQGITSQVLPALKTRYILTAILAHQGTAAQTLGEAVSQLPLRLVRAAPLPVIVIKTNAPVVKYVPAGLVVHLPALRIFPVFQPIKFVIRL